MGLIHTLAASFPSHMMLMSAAGSNVSVSKSFEALSLKLLMLRKKLDIFHSCLAAKTKSEISVITPWQSDKTKYKFNWLRSKHHHWLRVKQRHLVLFACFRLGFIVRWWVVPTHIYSKNLLMNFL